MMRAQPGQGLGAWLTIPVVSRTRTKVLDEPCMALSPVIERCSSRTTRFDGISLTLQV